MANYINFYSLLRQHKCIHTHTHTRRRGMSSLGGNPGCRIHSDRVAMETGSSAGECRSVCALKWEPQGRGWGCCYAMGELPWNQEGGWRQKRKNKKRRRNEEIQV